MTKLSVAFKTSSDTAVSLELDTDDGRGSIVGSIYEHGVTSYDELVDAMVEDIKDRIREGVLDDYSLDLLEDSSIKKVAKRTINENGYDTIRNFEAVNDDDLDHITYMQLTDLGQCDDEINDLIVKSDLLSDYQKQAWQTIRTWWNENQLKAVSSDYEVNKVIEAFYTLSKGNVYSTYTCDTYTTYDLLEFMVND